ncbi:hypothetical protein N7492_003833 [Penicillium capsulatum]|uniref:Fatty acid hydroxylase domain-containing protein n=1 Tax=Penicillium capsulatum TaxID=69766 RepID=A0A9W9LWK2_9EURO|nr:hypothetical protein N7492_003833 [Penicillium capsulatum]KAJ6121584.1 hypothetical protein N7512_004049 [Penicillium capsulatum]
MDALFSIPVLSIFLLPALSSYATSLNLIFFYMTWTTLVLSHTPLRVELFGTIAVRLLFYTLPSLLFFLFDILTPSAAVVIKAQGESGLPAGRKRGRVRVKDLKVAGWALLNICLGVAAQALVEYTLIQGLGRRSAIKVSMKLPLPWEMAKDLAFGLFIREILIYGIHRYALHSKQSPLESYHMSWYHALRAPFPLTAHYDHPLTYLVGRFIPTYLPAMLFRFHMLTFLLYLAVISVEETFVYSGYTIMPTNFFMSGIARRTDEHLLTNGEGNFGPWGVMDWICGTTIGESTVEDDLVSELEEHEIDDKVRKALEASKQKVREGTLRRNQPTRRRKND